MMSFEETHSLEPAALQLKTVGAVHSRKPGGQNHPERTDGAERHLVCRACGMRIARDSDRVVHQGRHAHVFCNPEGIVYELGCFSAAPGCAPAGPATAEFTWFKGFSWTVSVCSGCKMHLGWKYQSPSGSGFFGLILNRLTQEEG